MCGSLLRDVFSYSPPLSIIVFLILGLNVLYSSETMLFRGPRGLWFLSMFFQIPFETSTAVPVPIHLIKCPANVVYHPCCERKIWVPGFFAMLQYSPSKVIHFLIQDSLLCLDSLVLLSWTLVLLTRRSTINVLLNSLGFVALMVGIQSRQGLNPKIITSSWVGSSI